MLSTNKTYPHAMLSEIFEQPSAIADTLAAYSDGSSLREEVFSSALSALVGKESLLISASGSSRHAGLFGEILFEDLAGIPVDVEYASEYIYRSTHTLKNPCFLVISQSGETADTSEALREATAAEPPPSPSRINPNPAWRSWQTARSQPWRAPSARSPQPKASPRNLQSFGARSLHRPYSRTHDPRRSRIPSPRTPHHSRSDGYRPTPVGGPVIRSSATLQTAESFLFLGRGVHYPIAREGALKLKESAYIQAEGYPTGELNTAPTPW